MTIKQSSESDKSRHREKETEQWTTESRGTTPSDNLHPIRIHASSPIASASQQQQKTRYRSSKARGAPQEAALAHPVLYKRANSHSQDAKIISVEMCATTLVFASLALGSLAWHSGMVRPRKRIPSTGSRSEVSYTIDLTERMPP